MRKNKFRKFRLKQMAIASICCFVPTLLFAESNISTLNNFSLTSKSIASGNYVRLDWSLQDNTNKTFKVYQKKPGSSEFQSISSTNLNSSKQVRVLNVYPTPDSNSDYGIVDISFNTWDGETINTKSSAQVKKWMEEPNSEHHKGYGKGIIEVTPVSIIDFNENPEYYLKEGANYKYDVIIFGIWDSNANKDISLEAYNSTLNFINSGRGVLLGHDTMRGWVPNFTKLKDKLNMTFQSTNPDDSVTWHINNVVTLNKKGLLNNYPWNIGEVGDNLTVPLTHTVGQNAFGDIWLKFGATNDNNVDNFYLTTWNNVAMIQTGHSNGSATPDEQKILANTLFYLNQLSVDTFLNDYSGQDVAPPGIPHINVLSSSSTQLKFNFDKSKDEGSTYSYYVLAEDKSGSATYNSNTVTNVITSGLKGFSYVLDQNPSTVPSNTVNHTSGDLTINNIETGKTYYLHLKSIDKVGNISETVHYKINTSKPLSPLLNLSREGWGTTNASFNITQQRNRNIKIVSIGNSGTQPYTGLIKSYGYNVVDKPNNRNIEELLSYDLILYDAYCGGVVDNDILEELYKRGAKILTTGNDSTSHIYPITSTEYGSRPELLSIKRVVKNEATFSRATVGGGEDNSFNFITGTVPEAKVLYRHDYNNYPAIIEVANGNGGVWIHSQKILGMNYSENFDDLSIGLLEYITNYISQVHVSDTQYSINDGAWVSYNGGDIPITQEGYYNIAVRNVDNRGVSSDVLIKRVGIDRTAPYFSASVPSITQSRTVNVNLSGMGDGLSGIKYAKVSNYSDFRDFTGYTTVTGKTSATIPITIPFFADVSQNYSTRTIYVQLIDNVGNYKTISCTTKYEPRNPQNPVITSPKANQLYSDGEKVNVSWIYNDINNDGVKLPQSKAVITLKNTLNNRIYSYVISNTETDFNTGGLDSGVYEVTVQAFNSYGKSATSTPVVFRYNIFNNSGYVLSKSIELSTPIKYINVVSIVDLPINTRVEGYIYYVSKTTDVFNENKKVKFIISNNLLSDNAIRLPEKSSKIMVRWNLYSQDTNKPITPAIDDIIVYGR